jgi:hypothetical protein
VLITPHSMLPQTTPSTPTPPASGSGLPSTQGLDTMFLQLLVAQLQNQSPLNPMDPTQFVGQLAQFSELSQVTQINQTLQQLSGSDTTGGASPTPGGPAKPASVPAPAPIVSSAVSAAQAALPNYMSPAASFLQHKIEGVF